MGIKWDNRGQRIFTIIQIYDRNELRILYFSLLHESILNDPWAMPGRAGHAMLGSGGTDSMSNIAPNLMAPVLQQICSLDGHDISPMAMFMKVQSSAVSPDTQLYSHLVANVVSI